MIAKRIEFSDAQQSSFSRLVTYITHSQGKNERVGAVRIAHCASDNPEWAAMEAEATQAKNKRSGMDKTYHLLVSLREGENPPLEVMHAIEDHMCEALGYGEHQRVSAVHYDTDHMHIHIAINKIHPKRFTAHEPYFDKRKLGELCGELEAKYGLAVDNHAARMTQGEAKAQDMEKSAGVESMIGWIKRGCLPELLAASSWEELHAVLSKNGLEIRERANGLVITNGKDIAAKASSVARGLSKKALESKLGAFQAVTLADAKATAHYTIKPVASKVDTTQLWVLYQQERAQLKQRQVEEGKKAKQRRDKRLEAVKSAGRVKRVGIKLAKGKIAKKIMYGSVSQTLLKEMNVIKEEYKQARQDIYKNGKRAAWYDWLKAKAAEGNAQAIAILRSRYEKEQRRVNTIAGITTNNDNTIKFSAAKIDAITKRGTIHYQIAKSVLRDDGKVFRMAEGVDRNAIAEALQLAVQRFGTRLSVNGTEAFCKEVVSVAAEAKLSMIFSDPAMEKQRKALMAQRVKKPVATRTRGRRRL